MKKLPAEIKENLQFLCVEIDSQLLMLERYFKTPTPALAKRIRDRAGYAYNLKARIHMNTANMLASGVKRDSAKFTLRCIELIATDLERLAEISRKCIAQSEQLDDLSLLLPKPCASIVKKIRQALALVMPAIIERKSATAIEIEQINEKVRSAHERLMKRYLAELKKHSRTKQISLAMFVAYELKQFDETMLHISESIISANLGQPVNFERYFSLQSLVNESVEQEEVEIKPIAETRSGTAISGVTKQSDNDFFAIYKDGLKQKLKEEKQGLNSWHEIYPGLAPKILSYQKKGESAALLIEHLPGYTLEQIVVNEDQALLDKALKQLNKTLRSVWTETQTNKVNPANFMQQLLKRLPDVYRIHPEFELGNRDICGHQVASMDALIDQASLIEKQYPPPYSVYIHGDFNVDNIIYDPLEKRINFIDLHRSRYMDYVQDVSIFMVSNYRLQILDTPRRKQIMAVAIAMYKLAKSHARKTQDSSFEIRLALGLARAFATSTRFILDKTLAKRMFMRSKYLIESVVAVENGQIQRFKVPVQEIFVE